MFPNETRKALVAVADEYGIEAAALMAVADLETGGRAFAAIGKRREPLIRFEGHYFDRRLNETDRQRARRVGLAAPNAGAIANPASQAGRWALLDRAAAIDRRAAFESVSWGLGQVMGAHWAWLGYASVDALVAEARSSAEGQARLMARYIAKAGLVNALRQRDWAAFARGYNGPGYRANAYDRKLASAFARHADRPAESPGRGALLRSGSTGSEVADLQRLLTAAGFPLDADGRFGVATGTAVRAFQRISGIAVDGIAGPDTMRALRAARPFTSTRGMFTRFWSWLMRHF